MQKVITIPLPFKSLVITIRIKFAWNSKIKEYNEYLRSKQWFVFKSQIIEMRGFKCEICSSKKNLQLHHLSYKNFGNETPDDVMLLYEQCHEKAHNK